MAKSLQEKYEKHRKLTQLPNYLPSYMCHVCGQNNITFTFLEKTTNKWGEEGFRYESDCKCKMKVFCKWDNLHTLSIESKNNYLLNVDKIKTSLIKINTISIQNKFFSEESEY